MAELRLFIAARPPDAVRRKLDELLGALKSRGDGIKWVGGGNVHLTLKFLGNVNEAMVAALNNVAADSVRGLGQIRLAVGGVGAFPDMRRPRVIWTGLSGDIDRLDAAQTALEEACLGLGFPKEGRHFRPHLTLGRVKDRPAIETIKRVEQHRDVIVGDMVVSEIELIKSDLLPSGAVYTTLSRYPLT